MIVVIVRVEVGWARVGEHGRAVGHEREDGIGNQQAREALPAMLSRRVDAVRKQGQTLLPLELVSRIWQQLTTGSEDVLVVVSRIAGVGSATSSGSSPSKLPFGVHPEQRGLCDGCPDGAVVTMGVCGEAAGLERQVPDVELILVPVCQSRRFKPYSIRRSLSPTNTWLQIVPPVLEVRPCAEEARTGQAAHLLVASHRSSRKRKASGCRGGVAGT